MAGHGSGHNYTSAFNTVKRERDSAERNCMYWKKRAQEAQNVAYNAGFWAGIFVTGAIGVVIGVVALILFYPN